MIKVFNLSNKCVNCDDTTGLIEMDGEHYCKNECKISNFDVFTAIINHEDLDFIGYEFEINNGVYIDEYGGIQYLFRLDIDKETGDIMTNSAYSEDYDIMEYAGQYFDEAATLKKLQAHVKKEGLEEETFHGIEYMKANKGDF